MQIITNTPHTDIEVVSWELPYLYQFHADMLKELIPEEARTRQPAATKERFQTGVTEGPRQRLPDGRILAKTTTFLSFKDMAANSNLLRGMGKT